MKFIVATLSLVLLMSCSAHSIAGTWRGELDIQGNTIPIVIYIKDNGNNTYTATFDNAAQNIYGKEFDAVSFKDNQLALSSSEFDAIYAGYLSADKKSFEGSLNFRGQDIPMNLKIDSKK